jgi:hypothetical protein
MLLGECFLHVFAGIHNSAHINFVESGQGGVSLLRFLESASDCLSHLGHANTGLNSRATNRSGSSL